MAHLIFRCSKTGRVITTGIEVEASVIQSIHAKRTMPCRLCGQQHEWEVAAEAPDVCAFMSVRAEFFLGRAVEYEARALLANDPKNRTLLERVAGQWYQMAAEHERKALR